MQESEVLTALENANAEDIFLSLAIGTALLVASTLAPVIAGAIKEATKKKK